jgi:hypothetical protein
MLVEVTIEPSGDTEKVSAREKGAVRAIAENDKISASILTATDR